MATAPTDLTAIAPVTTDTKGNPISGGPLTQQQAQPNNPTAQPGYNPDLVNNLGQTNATVQAYNAADPTIAKLYGLPTDPDSLAASAASAKTAANSPAQLQANQDRANSQVLAQYQSQIDGIVQAEAAARARITNAFAPIAADRVGTTVAQQARGGNLGSNVGSGAVDQTNNANTTDLNSQIQISDAAYQNSLTKLQGDIVAAQNKKTEDLNTASSQGADALISQVQTNKANAQAQAVTQAKAAIAAGLDPNNPNMKADFSKWAQMVSQLTGLPVTAIQSTFTDAKNTQDQATAATAKAQGEAAKAGQTTVSPGQKIFDAKGNVIAQVSPTDKFTSQTLTDSLGNQRIVIYDQTTGQIKGYGDTGGGGGSGGGAATGAGSGIGGASTAAAGKDTSSLLFGANNDSTYANGTVQDALAKLGVKGAADVMQSAGIDPAAKVSDLPQAQRDALTKAVDGAGGFVNANPNVPFAEYGLLAKTDFNPDNTTDQLAAMYIDKYIKNGSVPTASTLGRNIKPGLMGALGQRAQDLYYKATGTSLPNPTIIKAQQDIIAGNYKLGNNLAIQEGTVKANVDLSLGNMTKNGLNSSGFKPLDELIDNVKGALQDPNVGQYLAQNSTIQNELGSLLAVKNAGGTTVYDKLTSAGIIGPGDAPDVIKQKVSALIQEAGNFASSLTKANETAYGFTDPLLQDSNNPGRAEYMGGGTPKAQSAGPSGNSGSTVSAPDGTQVIITD